MRIALVLAFAVLGAASVQARTPATISIQTYAGLSISGAVGMVYTVQYTTNLGQPDGQVAGIVRLLSKPLPLGGRRCTRRGSPLLPSGGMGSVGELLAQSGG